MTVWIIVPAYNEEESLPHVIPEISANLRELDPDGRVLVVDDGSSDTTPRVLSELALAHENVRYERLPSNQGKAAALQIGFTSALDAGADIVVMMDADGQDEPEELARLISHLTPGVGIVTGARFERQDRFIKRNTSKIYNLFTSKLSGAPGRDFNSGFKVLSADAARDVVPLLYGELHRYITVIAHTFGHGTVEVAVRHHPRRHGRTKYGIARFWRGFLDLLTIRFLLAYQSRPSHFFGGLGLAFLGVGGVALLYLLIEWLRGFSVGSRPLLITAVLLVITGLQLFLFGLLAELIVYGRQIARRPPPMIGRPPTGEEGPAGL